jgi:hypothetical protein
MTLSARLLLPALSLAGVVLAAGLSAAPAAPVALAADNAATSAWDPDPSMVGVELQIVNHGVAAADDVRVTGVAVQGGALSGPRAPPIELGTIASQGSALLDLVIAVPRTDGSGFLLTISGTYRSAGMSQPFSLTRTVAPSGATPTPLSEQSGVSGKAFSQPAGPPEARAGVGPPSFGPNATTPMLIPPGPPRQPTPGGPDLGSPATEQR